MRSLPPWLLSGALLLAACASTPATVETPVDEAPVREGLNDNFLDASLDVQSFVTRFEGESREVAVHHQAILAATGLEAGHDVADIGAGTGLFLEPFSSTVGPEGRLYAVDISPKFAEHLRARADTEGLHNVEVVLSDEKETRLGEASVDVAFVCDTYHHFTYPQTTLASLHRALRPGGTLVIVDFERIPGVSREWILGHVRAGKEEVIAEVESAGFELLGEHDVGLVENYLLRFRR